MGGEVETIIINYLTEKTWLTRNCLVPWSSPLLRNIGFDEFIGYLKTPIWRFLS